MTRSLGVSLSLLLAAAGCGGSDEEPPPPSKRVFVTSTGYSGTQVSVTFADTVCATSASAAQLGGSWKAWISSLSANASARIADVGPWFRMDGQKAFNNLANLATAPLVPISVDELGRGGIAGFAWTGTLTGGTIGDTCWDGSGLGTATYGVTNTTATWTQNGIYDCGNANGRLYCFEQ